MIDPARTFSTVYASSANSKALRMIKRAAHGARSNNPILIRGPVGSGKTQLMHAIANATILGASRPVRVLTAAGFRDDFVDAIRGGLYHSYRQTLAASGTLLVDALEDLAQSPSTEEVLAAATRAVVVAGGLVVLAVGPTSPDHDSRIQAWLATFPRATVLRWRAPNLEVRTTALARSARALAITLPRRKIVEAARGARTIPEATALLHRMALTAAQRRRA